MKLNESKDKETPNQVNKYVENSFRKKKLSKSSNTLVKDIKSESSLTSGKILVNNNINSGITSSSSINSINNLNIKSAEVGNIKEKKFIYQYGEQLPNFLIKKDKENLLKGNLTTSRTTFNSPIKRTSMKSLFAYSDKKTNLTSLSPVPNKFVKITEKMSKKFKNLNNENLKRILGEEEENLETNIDDYNPNLINKKRNSTSQCFSKKKFSDTLLPRINKEEGSFFHNKLNITRIFRSKSPNIDRKCINDMQPKSRFNRLKKEIMNQNVKVQSLLGDLKKQEKLNQDLLKVYVTNLKVQKIKKWKGLVEE